MELKILIKRDAQIIKNVHIVDNSMMMTLTQIKCVVSVEEEKREENVQKILYLIYLDA